MYKVKRIQMNRCVVGQINSDTPRVSIAILRINNKIKLFNENFKCVYTYQYT